MVELPPPPNSHAFCKGVQVTYRRKGRGSSELNSNMCRPHLAYCYSFKIMEEWKEKVRMHSFLFKNENAHARKNDVLFVAYSIRTSQACMGRLCA